MPSHDPYAADSAVKLDSSASAEAPVSVTPPAATPGEPAVESTQPEPAPVEAPKVEIPKGTTKELLAWVGDDHARAVLILESERASDEPRKGLMRALEELLVDGS